MVVTATPIRTTTGVGAFVALVLVLVFGSPAYVHWVGANTSMDTAGGFFLRTLAWPAWSFDSIVPVRDLIAADLRAVLLVVFTAVFLAVLAGAEVTRANGLLAALLTGWSAVIFAAALAGLLTAFVSAGSGMFAALHLAATGAGYAVMIGWLVGFAAMAARRP